MSVVLIVDDVQGMRDQYAYDLERLAGHEALTAGRGEEALELLEREAVDCVLLDLEMPGMDGFAVLKEIERRGLLVPVIVYTGTGNYERCVEAIKLGAYNFVDKAESMERVVQEIANALERGRLVSEVKTLRSRLAQPNSLIGESRAIQKLREEIARVAPMPSPVLVSGESGTGKELVARAVHDQSRRNRGAFLALNCAALPENLVESELFGHEAGAFTGADRVRKGAFETAHRGTLFLDEIGELPAPAQAKLLRVLEEDKVTRLGGNRATPVDTRVVAATNRDLSQEVEEGRFREDLLYRINVHQLEVPPLRERLSDVPLLVRHFVEILSRRFGMKLKEVSSETMDCLAAYRWQRNNVRELRNIVERMIIAETGEEIGIEAVPDEILEAGDLPAGGAGKKGIKELKARAEREIVLAALDRNDWHITNTAAELGLADHSSLLKIMRRHGLKKK
jgi:two-component system nitrogen regulation response regulator NtrX